jgi:hypothetical protein
MQNSLVIDTSDLIKGVAKIELTDIKLSDCKTDNGEYKIDFILKDEAFLFEGSFCFGEKAVHIAANRKNEDKNFIIRQNKCKIHVFDGNIEFFLKVEGFSRLRDNFTLRRGTKLYQMTLNVVNLRFEEIRENGGFPQMLLQESEKKLFEEKSYNKIYKQPYIRVYLGGSFSSK